LQLVSAKCLQEGGEADARLCDRASGLLIYDRSGEMSLQIAGERPADRQRGNLPVI